MLIISIASVKGGVGKTTTAANLGAALAALKKKILLIDFDPQGNLSQGLGFHQLDYSTFDFLKGTPLEKVKVSKEGFDLIPSNVGLADAEFELGSLPAREMCLKRVLKKINSNYEYCLIDCPPTAGFFPLNALTTSDYVLIPVETQYLPLEGLKTMEKFQSMVIDRLAPDLKLLGALATKFDTRRSLDREALEALKGQYKERAFKTVIRTNTALAEAPAHGQSIFTWAPSSTGAEDYAQLGKEFLERI